MKVVFISFCKQKVKRVRAHFINCDGILVCSREQLETEEANIDALEQKLDKVLKSCSLMIESGKTYMTHRG